MRQRQFIALLQVMSVLTVMLISGACRPVEVAAPTLPPPTITPPPRSTPLPAAPTVAPPGDAENPIVLVLQGDRDNDALGLERAALEDTGLALQVRLVDSQAAVLAALCASRPDAPTAAWMTGLGPLAAQAAGCGAAVLQQQVGTGAQASAVDAVVIVTRAEGGLETLSDVLENPMCRVTGADQAWLAAWVLLEAEALSPTQIDTIVETESLEALLEALSDRQCDAAVLSQSMLDELATPDRDTVTILASASVLYRGVLMLPVEVPLTVRERLLPLLRDLPSPLRGRLFGEGRLVAAAGALFDDALAVIERAGLDLEQLAADG